eukprot:TRINITY_DN3336_c0_g1_i2.p1 TRINITY_DN3336_c0_g1~~TRINITY_DN3336_c0_g1_i2.p1  ORF type:complete len:264 (+),score=53.08 TRINITY_DN3336_c0_g1_i2:100-891(+)
MSKQPNSCQVGGHSGALSLLFIEDKVLKPIGSGLNKELEFYDLMRKGEIIVKNDIIPKYFGTDTRSTEWGALQYMVLQNTTCGMKNPSICDLKMGTQTWDDDCSEKKKQGHMERDKSTTTSKFGFRFCGMKVYNAQTKKYQQYPKTYGWDANGDEEKLQLSVERYMDNGYGVQTHMIPTWLERLQKVKEFLELGTWKFYASSLLLVYDDNTDGPETKPPQCHMIDFVHTWRTQNGERDEGYLYGIETLVRLLNKILQKYSTGC